MIDYQQLLLFISEKFDAPLPDEAGDKIILLLDDWEVEINKGTFSAVAEMKVVMGEIRKEQLIYLLKANFLGIETFGGTFLIEENCLFLKNSFLSSFSLADCGEQFLHLMQTAQHWRGILNKYAE